MFEIFLFFQLSSLQNGELQPMEEKRGENEVGMFSFLVFNSSSSSSSYYYYYCHIMLHTDFTEEQWFILL